MTNLVSPAIDFNLNSYKYRTNKKPIELTQVSLSQLLGRDYLFIDFSESSMPHDERDFYASIETIMSDLGLSPAETVVIGIVQSLDGNQFTRYELTWLSDKIRRLESVEVKTVEQQAFMQMIWQCTSPIPAH